MSSLALNATQSTLTKTEPTVTAPKDQSALQRFVTDKKVQQVFWCALMVLSCAAGGLGLALSLVVLAPAMPVLGAIAGIASMMLAGFSSLACMGRFLDVMNHYNYQDSRDIERARREIASNPKFTFSHIATKAPQYDTFNNGLLNGYIFEDQRGKHGLDNLLKYNILSLEELRLKFQMESAGQDFFNLRMHYDLKKLRECGIMTLDEQRTSFEKSIKGKTLKQILQRCHLDALQRDGILCPTQMQKLPEGFKSLEQRLATQCHDIHDVEACLAEHQFRLTHPKSE